MPKTVIELSVKDASTVARAILAERRREEKVPADVLDEARKRLQTLSALQLVEHWAELSKNAGGFPNMFA